VDATDDAEVSERDVVIPLPLYKVVTVFSTLISGAAVVFGFVVLDEATQRASASVGEIDPLLALLGLFLIAGGGAMYAFSGRFRAPGMGTTKTDETESPDNG
jgi:lipopolysaccharide export LptBFGC system permease protein LptF